MSKVARIVVVSLAIGASVAAVTALPAVAKRAPRHYVSTCDWKRAHWSRGVCRRRQTSLSVKEAEGEAVLQCLLSQPFATCE